MLAEAQPATKTLRKGGIPLQPPSEVRGMLAFLQDKRKGLTGTHRSRFWELYHYLCQWILLDGCNSRVQWIVARIFLIGNKMIHPTVISLRYLDDRLRSSITGS